MAIIDQEGLFKGKRLRKCSPAARWRWPYLFLLSNGYARIELDYECIADEFSSFRESAPTPDELRETFGEFRANHLLYVYRVNDQEWGQWDTRRSLLKEYKTAADKGSPAPPEPEYWRWLIEQHGNDWAEFHWNKDLAQGTPDTDSPKTLPNIDQALPKVFQQIEAEPCGVGVGSGVGEGTGKESKPLAHSANELGGDVSPDLPLEGKNEPSEPPEREKDQPNSDERPKKSPTSEGTRLAEDLRDQILGNNESAKITDKQIEGWAREADHMMRLDGRTEEQIAVLIAWSQHHPFWLKNILSMGKLRQQFDRLTLEMKSPKGNANGNVTASSPRTERNRAALEAFRRHDAERFAKA